MSYVNLLAASRPMPVRDCRTMRKVPLGEDAYMEGEFGFAVLECPWNPYEYSHCKTLPFVYSLELVNDAQTCSDLQTYLEETMEQGEEVQLWAVWLGGPGGPEKPEGYRGRLEDFDEETFALLFDRRGKMQDIQERRITIQR